MDWKNLFLSAQGRIGRQEFWIGFAILLVAGFIIGLILRGIPILAALVSVGFLYFWVCLGSKRFHDMGKTGWLMAVPTGLNILIQGVALLTAGTLTGAAAGGAVDPSTMSGATLASAGLLGLLGVVTLLVCLGFLLWLGIGAGEPGENKYGAPPTRATATAA